MSEQDLWTSAEAAAHCGISAGAWRHYVAIELAPPPDLRKGRMNLWHAQTVRQWHAARRGRGWRAGQHESDNNPDKPS